jgi:flagellar hook-associated protein 2
MAISSAGVGSGLNVQSIVSQLVAVEQQPVRLMQAKGSTLQTKMSAFSQIKSELAALQDAANALTSASVWNSKTLTSSNTSAVIGTASAEALATTFSISVGTLAKGQSVYSGAVTTGFPVTVAGDLTITSGNGNVQTVAVAIGDSLENLATKVNATTTANGVSATVVTNSQGNKQLMFRSSSIGANASFQIAATGADLQQFVYAGADTASMTRGSTASDATANIDGINVAGANNTLSNSVPGVSLNLLQGTSTAQITVAVDKDAIKAKIQAFQDAYNKLYADLKTQTAYNSATKTGGPLLGDNTATSMQGMLRTLIGGSGPASSTIKRLSDLGLEIQSDGSLKTNSTKLDSALQDPGNVKAFFAASTGTASEKGIAKRVYDFAFGALSVGGSASTHISAFQKAIDQNNKSIERFNSRIETYQKQLLAQYNALDTNMAKLSSLSSYVSQQITAWNKSS